MDNQPIKDLQYFKDQVATEEDFINWRGLAHVAPERYYEESLDIAAERYAQCREQKAKEEAWEKGYIAAIKNFRMPPDGNPETNPYKQKEEDNG